MMEKKKHSRNFAPKMPTINEIGQTVLANTLYTRIKEVLGE